MASFYGRPAIDLTATELAEFGIAAGLIKVVDPESAELEGDGKTRNMRFRPRGIG